MAWPFKQREATGLATMMEMSGISPRGGRAFSPVTRSNAMRASAVWACLRLRADLISTMPVGNYISQNGLQTEIPKQPFFTSPSSGTVDWAEWVYSSQVDLDSTGNAFGVIKGHDGYGLPTKIDLLPVEAVTVRVRDGVVSYDVNGERYTADKIWHEKQYTSSGMPVGLSPIAMAAVSINGYLSAQQFAFDWFSGGGTPNARLKNTAKKITPNEAEAVKSIFRASVQNGDLFVHGQDWDYEMIAAKASEAMFIEERQFGLGDICRFLGVPGDMIDASSSGSSITYANITQRNLQLLIMNIGPAIARREQAWSRRLMAQKRFATIDTNSILRMDPATLADLLVRQVAGRTLAPSEARATLNRAPFTPEQIAEFTVLFPNKAPTPTAPIGAPPA